MYDGDGDAHTDYEEMIADTDGSNSNDYFHIKAVSNTWSVTLHFSSSSNRSLKTCCLSAFSEKKKRPAGLIALLVL